MFRLVSLLLQGNAAGIFGHLRRFAGRGFESLQIPVAIEALGVDHVVIGLLHSVRRIVIRPLSFGDCHGQACFTRLKRSVQGSRRLQAVARHIPRILSPRLSNSILRFDVLHSAGSIVANDVFHHYDIRRLADREIRFRGNNHSE